VLAGKKRMGAERAEGNGECIFRYFVLCYFLILFLFNCSFVRMLFFFLVIFFWLFFPSYDREVMSRYIRKFPGEIRNQG